MGAKSVFFFVIIGILQGCVTVPDYSGFANPGLYSVETKLGTWINDDRDDREVLWKLFSPVGRLDLSPVIVVSPGGGGTRDDPLNYLGEHLASYGFIVFQLQHRGSDGDAFNSTAGAMGTMEKIRNSVPSLAELRQEDILFAADQIEVMSKMELAGKVDTSRMGLAGFSWGAVTSLISAGMELPELGQTLAEPRFKAVLVLSPSARFGIAEPVLDEDVAREAYSNMLMPIFHMRGTQDITAQTGITEGIQRELPFRVIDSVDQYHLVLYKAEHPTFGGSSVQFRRNPELRRPFDYPELGRHRELIRMAATLYWKAYLEDDDMALDWLTGSGFASELQQSGKFEIKPALP